MSSELTAALIGAGAALLGAVVGGVITAHLQHNREQRYAARALGHWFGSTQRQLAALVQAIEAAPEDSAFTYWRQFTHEPLSATERADLLRSLPEWLDNVVTLGVVAVEQLRVAISASDAQGLRAKHATLLAGARTAVRTMVDAEKSLAYFLDHHSELFGDDDVRVPEKWRAERLREGRPA